MVLHQQRRIGMAGSEPLDIMQVRSWLQAHGWHGEGEVEALDMLLEMDAAYMAWGRRDADGPSS